MQSSNSTKLFRHLILSSISLSICFISFSQKKTLRDITNELYLNTYVYGKTDTSLFKFLKENIPYLTIQPPAEGWINPPRIEGDEKMTNKIYSFKSHPFFNLKSKEGLLDFEIAEYSPGDLDIKEITLKLFFENKKDADSAFNILVRLLTPFAEQKDIKETTEKKVAKFIENTKDKWPRKASLVLKNNIDRPGGYLILFKDDEPDNF